MGEDTLFPGEKKITPDNVSERTLAGIEAFMYVP